MENRIDLSEFFLSDQPATFIDMDAEEVFFFFLF
jgi:hypothetical protein